MKNLEKELLKLYEQQDLFMQAQYDRSLSFQDGMFDRFERAKRLRFGEGSSIYNSALIFGKVNVGIKTWIGPYVILDGSGENIEIGEYCSISANVHIYTHDSVMWALSGGKSPIKIGKVSIGNCTYIGSQSIIVSGVTIGSHCVIGANTFVNQDVDDHSIVVGSPAKKVGMVLVDDDQNIKLQYEK